MTLNEVLSDDLVFSMVAKLVDAGKEITFDHIERSRDFTRVHHGKLLDIIQHGGPGTDAAPFYTVIYQAGPTRKDGAKLKPHTFAKLKLQRWGGELTLSDATPQPGDEV